jgi:hypothetical protein
MHRSSKFLALLAAGATVLLSLSALLDVKKRLALPRAGPQRVDG